MFSKLRRNGKIYAFFNLLITEDNPFDRPVIDKDKVIDDSKTTGWERIKNLFSKQPETTFHPKLVNIFQTACASFLMGGVIGAVKSSRTTFIQFIENNEATKFDSHFHAKRQLSDKMFVSFIQGGTRMGTRVSFFCTSLIFAYVMIATYRNKDEIWYYSLAGAYAGAIYKFPLGPKGMISGGIFGSVFGSIYGGFHYLILLALKKSEQQYQESLYQQNVEREKAVARAKKNINMKEIKEDFMDQMKK